MAEYATIPSAARAWVSSPRVPGSRWTTRTLLRREPSLTSLVAGAIGKAITRGPPTGRSADAITCPARSPSAKTSRSPSWGRGAEPPRGRSRVRGVEGRRGHGRSGPLFHPARGSLSRARRRESAGAGIGSSVVCARPGGGPSRRSAAGILPSGVGEARPLGDAPLEPELRQLGVGRMAGLRVPTRHLVVGAARGEKLPGIDPLAPERAVADPLVHPPRQDVVGRCEALAAVEDPRERVVPLADLHQLVEAHVPARHRVDVGDERFHLEPVEGRADEVANADR